MMSYYTMFFIGSLPIGHLAAGALAERIGRPLTFLAGGIACALAGTLSRWGCRRSASTCGHLRRAGIIPSTGEPPE